MCHVDQKFNRRLIFVFDFMVASSDPFIEIGVIHDHLFVAFEMNNIDRVKSYQAHQQSQVCVSEHFTKQELFAFEHFLAFINMQEKCIECFFVSFVRKSEPSLVDTIQDILVNPTISCLFDLLFKLSWKELVLSCLQRCKIVIEHSDNFLALIVDNGVRLFIPEDRNSEWIFKSWASQLIYSPYICQIIDMIDCFNAWSFRRLCFVKDPRCSASFLIDNTPFRCRS